MLKYLSHIVLIYLYCNCSVAAEPTPLESASSVPLNTEVTPEISIENTTPIRLTAEQMLERLEDTEGENIKLNDNGDVILNESEQWDCVHQKASGLTWEVKTSSGLRDKTNTYTWVTADSETSSFVSWFENVQGKCIGESRCDTSSYIAVLNQQQLCNFSDWRLPTRTELENLIVMNNAKNQANIDNKLFPNTLPSWYWTDSINETHPDYVWYVLFRSGTTLSDKKHHPKHLRLVRGSL